MSTSLDAWLAQIGFREGNPFGTSEAEREAALLAELFVDTGQFPLLRSFPNRMQSTLLVAPRGNGKTAYRIMLQQQCRPQSPTAADLAISITDWEPLVEEYQQQGYTSVTHHVNRILEKGVQCLLASFLTDPALLTQLRPSAQSALTWYLHELGGRVLAAESLYDTMQLAAPGFAADWKAFRAGVRNHALTGLLQAQGCTASVALWLAEAVDFGGETHAPANSPVELFARFVELTLATGIRHVHVLVDRLDETSATATTPRLAVDLMGPLISNLQLLETPGASFLFFVPASMQAQFLAYAGVRRDRLPVQELTWTPDGLAEVLARRLAVFSNGMIRSLAQVCTSPLEQNIEQELVRWAGGSPRRLLRLAALLFDTRVHTSTDSLLLTQTDWEHALEAFLQEYPPPVLRIPREPCVVFIGTHEVRLTPLEHRFLQMLWQAGGYQTKNELAAEVWESADGITDQAISRLVRRIREKIEPYPSTPIYLLTETNAFRLKYTAAPHAAR